MTLTPECPELDSCRDRRTLDAEHRGKVIAELQALNTGVGALWDEMKVHRRDMQTLYFKVGLIAGGSSLIISLVVSLVMIQVGGK